jgi:transposase InsO family protein
VTDVTYVWTLEGWLYLAVLLDLFSRRVVGWAAIIAAAGLLMAMRARRYCVIVFDRPSTASRSIPRAGSPSFATSTWSFRAVASCDYGSVFHSSGSNFCAPTGALE